MRDLYRITGMGKTSTPLTDFTDIARALPYRPTVKLTPTARGPIFLDGWKGQEFRDALGNIYERERDGEWERWWLIEERREDDGGRILYRADLRTMEPECYYDCLAQKEDLQFVASAICGLVKDAQRRGLFPEDQLERLQGIADQLADHASSLEPTFAKPGEDEHASPAAEK